jgi:hypothetical protein
MTNDEEIKGKVFQILKAAKSKKTGTHKTNPKDCSTINQTAIGNSNLQVAGDVNLNTKQYLRPKITPGPEHISPSQGRQLRDLVKKAVEIELISGKQTKEALFAKWYERLRNNFGSTTYSTIKSERGEEAINWMRQEVAKLRPKLRRTDKQAWFKEHYSAIWARAKELGLTKPQVYALASERVVGEAITSLTQLGERNLKKLYNIIMSIPR